MNTMMRAAFTALVLTTLGLAGCSDPTLSGPSDAAQIFTVQLARMTTPPIALAGVGPAAAAANWR